MSSTHIHEPISRDEYFSLEGQSPIRHEFVGGQLYAMVGDSAQHNTIVTNLTTLLKQHLRGNPCRVFSSTFKLAVGHDIYYPDLFVACEPPEKTCSRTAKVVIEVLSESTKRYDQTEKFAAYRALPDLQEYILIAQDARSVITHRAKGDWESTPSSSILSIESLDFDASLDLVYEDVL